MPSLGRGERRPLARENNAPLSYWVSSWLWLLRAVAERKIGARRDPATQCWNGWGAPRRAPPRTRCGQMTGRFSAEPHQKIRLSCPVTAAANVPAEMNKAVIVLIDPSAGHEPFGQSLDVHYQLPLRAPPDCFYDVPGSPLSAAASGAPRQHDGGAAARHCADGNRHARRDRGWRQATGGRRSTPRRADDGPGGCRARRGPVSLRPLCRRRNLFSFSSRRRTANRSTTGISPACAAPAATTTRSPACSQSRRGWLFVELIPGSRHTAPRVSAVVEALAFNLSVSLSSQRRTKILESINDRRSRSFSPGIARSRSTSF